MFRTHGLGRRQGTRVAAVVLTVVTLAACHERIPTFHSRHDRPAYVEAVLVQDGADGYEYTVRGAAVDVTTRAGNRGSELRTVFWPQDAPPTGDQESCARWTGRSGRIVQQGAALRVRSLSPTRTRAVTVTQNIMFVQYYVNFHVWDSAAGQPFQQIGHADLRGWFAERPPMPWTLCARTIGNTVEFKIWSATESEPGYGEPGQSGRATIPAGWVQEGWAGWYVGHLEPGDRASFDDLHTYALVPPGTEPPSSGRPTSQSPVLETGDFSSRDPWPP